MRNDGKKKTELWRMIVFVLIVAFIVFMWVKKDIAGIYTTMPGGQIVPLVVTTIAVLILQSGIWKSKG